MVDLTDQERAAIRVAVRPLAEAMGEIGWQTRLLDLTEPQVLLLVELAVRGFRDAMQAAARAGDGQEAPL